MEDDCDSPDIELPNVEPQGSDRKRNKTKKKPLWKRMLRAFFQGALEGND